jgi:rod shape-determining protein MreD
MFDAGIAKSKLLLKQWIPLGCLFIAVILDRSSVLGFLPAQPLLSLPTVYYWSLHRPDWVSILGVLGIGILDDALSGGYLGQNTILLLLVYLVVLKQMDYFISAGFARTWGAFFVIMGMCGAIQWGFSAFLYQDPMNVFQLFIETGATALAFPVVYFILNRIAYYTYDWD